LKRGPTKKIVREVQQVVPHWKYYAEDAGVTASWREKIQSTLQLEIG